MKINLIVVGKTSKTEIKNICGDYMERINRYVKIEEVIVENRAVRPSDWQKTREQEGELLLKKISPADYVILLDDKGKEYTSELFAGYIENLFNQSLKTISFIVGGAYGFNDALYKRANAKMSLSKMTFSHQIIRPVFLEQLYRAFTIINNEPYHHA